MKIIYEGIKKIDKKNLLNLPKVSLVVHTLLWLFLGGFIAYLVGKAGKFDEAMIRSYAFSFGSLTGLIIGYTYGVLWLMKYAERSETK